MPARTAEFKGPSTLAQTLSVARAQLARGRIEDPALEARMIVEYFSGTSRAESIARPDQLVSESALGSIRLALGRRLAGEPVHRIFGWREFHGLRLALSPDTLEPRPDTEVIVGVAVARLGRGLASGERLILDLGTGTGAIGLAIAHAVPDVTVTATDISAGALETAAANAAALGLGHRFRTVCSDWFSRVDGIYHGIVTNPPYIPTEEIDALDSEVRLHDPRRALDGGADGLDAYRHIAAGAKAFLRPGGFIAVEIGKGQGQAVEEIFRQAGHTLTGKCEDLSGTLRVIVFDDGGEVSVSHEKMLGNHGECG